MSDEMITLPPVTDEAEATDEIAEPAPLRIVSLDEALGADDLPERVVSVPQWGRGAAVRIKALTKGQQRSIRHRATVRGEVDQDKLELLLFVEGVVEPKFTPAHAQALLEKSWGAVDGVIKEVMTLSGMLAEQREEAVRRFPAR